MLASELNHVGVGLYFFFTAQGNEEFSCVNWRHYHPLKVLSGTKHVEENTLRPINLYPTEKI